MQLRIGVVFDENQLNDRGWFIDTDSLDDHLKSICDTLSAKKWTETFDFRPTLEHVARWVFRELEADVPQLHFIEIENRTIQTITRYEKE